MKIQNEAVYQERVVGQTIISAFNIAVGLIILFLKDVLPSEYILFLTFLFIYVIISALIWLGLSLFNYVQLRKHYGKIKEEKI